MSKTIRLTQRLIAYFAALVLANISFVSAHLTFDECIQGSGCIGGKLGGNATFQFSAMTTTSPASHSGTLTFVDASTGINLTSSTLLEYGGGSTPSERALSYQLSGGTYAEARIFVSDSGPATADTFRIQLLDAASVPVFDLAGTLLPDCGTGITISPTCPGPTPCELEVSVACLVQAGSNPSTTGCTITGNSGEVTFFYTIRNAGTTAIPFGSLTGSDSFGSLDLSSLGNGTLQPGEQVSMTVQETVSGPFPFVNTVTFTSTQNGVTCSDVATITINHQEPPTEPPAEEECPDFVTGGGWIVGTPSGGKANFGVHGGIKKGGLWGGLNYLDHKARLHVKSTSVTGYSVISEVGRQINFNVTINGVAGTAIVKVHDNGEPGRHDLFSIELSTGYTASGDLGGARAGGGNIQLHKRDCDGHGGGGDDDDDGDGDDGDGDGDGDDDGDGGNGGGQPPAGACPFTIGYWKNHDTHLAQVLSKGAINLGSMSVDEIREATWVLGAASSVDARLMLRAQLLATLLNLQNGSSPLNAGTDIDVVVDAAVQFLATHPSPVASRHPDRNQALALKDKLDAYNNSKGNCDDGKPGDDDDDDENGKGGRDDDDDDDDGDGQGKGDGDDKDDDDDDDNKIRCPHKDKCKNMRECYYKSQAEQRKRR